MLYRSTWLLAIMGLALTGSPTTAVADEAAQAEHARWADTDVLDAVERELREDRALPFDDIDVAVHEGIVTLRGAVDNVLAHERAVLQAQTVRGVRGVVNLLVVVPKQKRTDEQILQDVKAALFADPAADSYEVAPAVSEGTVTLSGTVDSWHERRLSETVAKGVSGVRSIVNKIDVAYANPEQRKPLEIEAEIKQALRWDAYVDHEGVDVVVDDGVVRLSGTVGSAAQKQRIVRKAYTRGVTSVDASRLHVVAAVADPRVRTQKLVELADGDVRKAVAAAFVQDPRVASYDVTARVRDGFVTLTGEVDNLRARRSAEQSARNTVGVEGVRNHIRVRDSDPRSDESIAADIRAALVRHPYTNAFEIAVKVDQGRVRLTGSVDNLFERAQADELAARTRGVRDIVNRIQVEDRPLPYDPYVDLWSLADGYVARWPGWTPSYSDPELKRRVEAELFWTPFVDASAISVYAAEGIVTLAGTVGSRTEAQLARANAYEAGAALVRDELEVPGRASR